MRWDRKRCAVNRVPNRTSISSIAAEWKFKSNGSFNGEFKLAVGALGIEGILYEIIRYLAYSYTIVS